MRSAGLPLTIGYTGHPWDRALGQYAAPFRYYNPATARWNMRDPLGFVDGPNVYAYVAGNPVMGTDPSGGVGAIVVGGTILIGGALAIAIILGGLGGIDIVGDHTTPLNCEYDDPVRDWDTDKFKLPRELEDPIKKTFREGEPGRGWSRRGGDKGNYYDGNNSISKPDAHKGHDLHVDVHVRGLDPSRWWVYPDGRCVPKP